MNATEIKEIKQAAMRCQDLMELLNYSHKGLVEDKFAMMEPVFREFHRVASAAKISDLCLYVEQLQTEAEKAREYKESAERELAIRSDVEAVSGGPDTIILPKPVLVHISSEERLVIPLHSTLTELTRLGYSFCYEDENS